MGKTRFFYLNNVKNIYGEKIIRKTIEKNILSFKRTSEFISVVFII